MIDNLADTPHPRRAPEAILIVLSGGPKSLSDIHDAFCAYGRRPPGDPRPRITGFGDSRDLRRSLLAALKLAHARGWTSRDEESGRYQLTNAGRREAERILARLHARREHTHRLLQPSDVARTTMAAQVAVTLIKIPAALMSGSVAQLNDAVEEILDVIASVAVYLGVRAKRERLANVTVIALMVATACATLTMAVHRLIKPVPPTVSWYPLTVAVASIFIYTLRSTYERAAGLRGNSESLTSQSIDSRNHALAGLAVTAGLLTGGLHVAVVDTVIGLALALTILRSSLVLTRDLIRSIRAGGQMDLSRYSLWAADSLEHVVRTRIRDWLLEIIATDNITTRAELLHRIDPATHPATNPLLREYGMELDIGALVEPALADLIHHGLIHDTDQLTTTDTGQHHRRRTPRSLSSPQALGPGHGPSIG